MTSATRLYLAGAAAAVPLTFAVMAAFGARAASPGVYPCIDLLRWAPARALAHPAPRYGSFRSACSRS